MMMIVSLSIGSHVGEWINLDYRMEQFGRWLKKKAEMQRIASYPSAIF